MNGRKEIVSAGGVPGNRHATSVPPPFPAGPTRSRHPSATGRAGLHAGGTRCAAWPTSSRRSGTPPRPGTSPGTRPVAPRRRPLTPAARATPVLRRPPAGSARPDVRGPPPERSDGPPPAGDRALSRRARRLAHELAPGRALRSSRLRSRDCVRRDWARLARRTRAPERAGFRPVSEERRVQRSPASSRRDSRRPRLEPNLGRAGSSRRPRRRARRAAPSARSSADRGGGPAAAPWNVSQR